MNVVCAVLVPSAELVFVAGNQCTQGLLMAAISTCSISCLSCHSYHTISVMKLLTLLFVIVVDIVLLCVTAGHSCWGILNGPATGKALAELICTGESQCVDLAPFNPARLIRKSQTVRQKEQIRNYERTHLADLEPML